ncbi:MAG TPA: globin domain-containing protein [Acidimicrobiales bacterium]|nr:globin domain-containing protein [Acidimicrobiales bacterium]
MIDAAGLKKNWNAIAQHGDQVPLYFYSTLFLTHPYTRDMFPVSMAAQRDRLVAALGQVVSRVDDLDSVVPVLRQLGRDHRKFAVVRDHYPAVGEALLATLEHFSGDDWTDRLAADWAAAYGIVAEVMIAAADAAAGEPAWWEARVVAHERRTVDVAVLRVLPEGRLPYLAGQSLSVESPLRPRLWRYYSPATLPDADGAFELHVRIVDGGPVSTALVQSTQVGDPLRLGPAVGTRLTVPAGAPGDLVLLAGGTGLAPMKAVIQQVAVAGTGKRIDLFWGARRYHDLYDLPAMHALSGASDGVRLVPCVSHEPTMGSYIESGTAVDVALRHGPWPDHDIYVCGSPAMVAGTMAVLEGSGAPLDRVHVEDFGSEEPAV